MRKPCRQYHASPDVWIASSRRGPDSPLRCPLPPSTTAPKDARSRSHQISLSLDPMLVAFALSQRSSVRHNRTDRFRPQPGASERPAIGNTIRSHSRVSNMRFNGRIPMGISLRSVCRNRAGRSHRLTNGAPSLDLHTRRTRIIGIERQHRVRVARCLDRSACAE